MHRIRRPGERIRKALEHIDPERVYLTTDCGLKALPRFCAFQKLNALGRAAARVRDEAGARGAVAATAGA
jgi:5-methyltetrahydropteroyltriglutamate--homocysteine methyltransferase